MKGRTTRDQVRGHDNISEKAEQGRLEGKVEDVQRIGMTGKKHMVDGLA